MILAACMCFLYLSRYVMILAACMSFFFLIVRASCISFSLTFDSRCMYELFLSDWPFYIKAFLVYPLSLRSFFIWYRVLLSRKSVAFAKNPSPSYDFWGRDWKFHLIYSYMTSCDVIQFCVIVYLIRYQFYQKMFRIKVFQYEISDRMSY